VHAVQGNHDWWEDKTVQREGLGPTIAARALETVGIPVYENDARRLSKDGHPFWLAGLGDQLAFMPARRFRPLRRIGVDDLGATLAKVTDDAPVILMAHEPDVARRGPRAFRCNSPGIPMAGRCACWAGRRSRPPGSNWPTATSA
jgi:predicted MPP superfamily phosphohydrolase